MSLAGSKDVFMEIEGDSKGTITQPLSTQHVMNSGGRMHDNPEIEV